MNNKEEMKQKIIELNDSEVAKEKSEYAVSKFIADNRFKCPNNIKNFGNTEPVKHIEPVPEPDIKCPSCNYMWAYVIGFALVLFLGSSAHGSSSASAILGIICFFATFRVGSRLKKEEQKTYETTDEYNEIMNQYKEDCKKAEDEANYKYSLDCQEYAKYKQCVNEWKTDFDKRIKPLKDEQARCTELYRKLYKDSVLPEPLKARYYRNKVLNMINQVPSSLEFIINIVMKEYVSDKEIERAKAERAAQASYERSEQASREAAEASYAAEERYREYRDARATHMAEGAVLGYVFSKHRNKK